MQMFWWSTMSNNTHQLSLLLISLVIPFHTEYACKKKKKTECLAKLKMFPSLHYINNNSFLFFLLVVLVRNFFSRFSDQFACLLDRDTQIITKPRNKKLHKSTADVNRIHLVSCWLPWHLTLKACCRCMFLLFCLLLFFFHSIFKRRKIYKIIFIAIMFSDERVWCAQSEETDCHFNYGNSINRT